MKNFIFYLCITVGVYTTGCSSILDQDPDTILTEEQVYGDEVMLESVLANFYGRVHWGQATTDSYSLTILDEAGKSDGGPDQISDYGNDMWRVYDYGLIRNINQFLKGLRASNALSTAKKGELEGEVRFLRAWTYFNMIKGMGGMPLVGDEVFEYTPGMDITALQYPRSTEAEAYDYVIQELEEIIPFLSKDKKTNAARANRWVALMLQARASVYAGSIANYNNKMVSPIKTVGQEVGIDAGEAKRYYEQALKASEEVINSSPYILSMKKTEDLARNFYEAINIKDNNDEVIWARDYKYPGQTVNFTNMNIPASHAEDIDRAYAGPLLNLIEDFEFVNNRSGELKFQNADGSFVYFDHPLDLFENKDARLSGTVILPGSDFKGTPVILQAGQKILQGGTYQTVTSELGATDSKGNIITSINGPITSNVQYVNKTGFFFRKFLDETPSASTRGRHSDMWFPRFRMAEAFLIAAEAALELGNSGKALEYINKVRERGGIQKLTSITIQDIVQERRVEFAFENHRYWDLKRLRLADKVWNGSSSNAKAVHYALFPYKVVAPGQSQDGKWVFEKVKFVNSPNPRNFQLRNYYNFIDQTWINNNPKLAKNPYQ